MGRLCGSSAGLFRIALRVGSSQLRRDDPDSLSGLGLRGRGVVC